MSFSVDLEEIELRIQEVLARRSDLSTFLVHLSRTFGDLNARQRLESILLGGSIEASSPFGQAVTLLRQRDWPVLSQYWQERLSWDEIYELLEHPSLMMSQE